ncbi:MAG TPA: DUF6084 family protein [Gammaproteobacteria bacterium]|nr:DUF6084 family protein [Gammaproteobacteria bacterium]
MPGLSFEVSGARALFYAAEPTLILDLRVTNSGPGPVEGLVLDCQVRIAAARRDYSAAETDRLGELTAGADPRTGIQGLPWTRVQVNASAFRESRALELPLTCSLDFNRAAPKYFHGLLEGEVPLSLQFSGTVFRRDVQDRLQVERIPWDREAAFRLPVSVWRAVVDHYYPNQAWLELDREVFDRLYAFKRNRNLATWEGTIDRLLKGAGEDTPDGQTQRHR